MRTLFKINTALLICLAFVFRLLFVNIPMISDAAVCGNSQNNSKRTTVSINQGHFLESLIHANNKSYPAVEFCEENQDNEENEAKLTSPVLMTMFCSLLGSFSFIEITNVPFDLIKVQLFPKRYLALSILRI